MKIITQMIRNLFGIPGNSQSDAEAEGEVQKSDITVEREPETEGEGEVAETESATEPEIDAEPEVVEETDGETTEDDDAAAEVETESDEVTETDTETETVEAAETDDGTETADDGPGGEPVIEISGIGPTYSDRLTEAGIATISDLANSDAETVAETAEVSESRASDWIQNATDQL